jgi:hypothetical protein
MSAVTSCNCFAMKVLEFHLCVRTSPIHSCKTIKSLKVVKEKCKHKVRLLFLPSSNWQNFFQSLKKVPFPPLNCAPSGQKTISFFFSPEHSRQLPNGALLMEISRRDLASQMCEFNSHSLAGENFSNPPIRRKTHTTFNLHACKNSNLSVKPTARQKSSFRINLRAVIKKFCLQPAQLFSDQAQKRFLAAAQRKRREREII